MKKFETLQIIGQESTKFCPLPLQSCVENRKSLEREIDMTTSVLRNAQLVVNRIRGSCMEFAFILAMMRTVS